MQLTHLLAPPVWLAYRQSPSTAPTSASALPTSGLVTILSLPPEPAAKPADVRIPLQAHFANKDDWCTPQLVDAFEKAMKAAGKSLEIYRYDAEHGFANEQRQSVHDRAAAELAWDRATGFFKKHLE